MIHRRTGLPLLLAAAGALAGAAHSQSTFPSRSLTLVVPFAAGGPTDVVARSLAAVMGKSLGQSVVVENKLGAGGTLAAGAVAKAALAHAELGAEIVPEAKQTPEGLRTWLKPEIDKWGALIRAAGNCAD